MSQAETAEKLIFGKPPYLTAAEAIAAGDMATLQRLIAEGLDVNYEGRETETPWGKDTVTLLLWAAVKHQPGCGELLLKAGANPDKATASGLTPLMMALTESDVLFDLLLVRYKADTNKIYNAGVQETALTLALSSKTLGERRWQHAEMLLKHGANVNLGLDRGETAILLLMHLRDFRAVLWLLEHGANPEARDSVNATTMTYLRDSYATHLDGSSENDLYRDKVRDWLLAHGVERSRLAPAQPH